MYQKLTFTVAKEKAGEIEYYELATDRLIDASERWDGTQGPLRKGFAWGEDYKSM